VQVGKTLGWLDSGGKFYAAGTSLSSLLTGTVLTAGYDVTAPTVSSIEKFTHPEAIFRVTFSEAVTGVDKTDFTLTTTGTATGSIYNVSAVSGQYTDVTIDSISGAGDLRLDLKNSGAGIADIGGDAITTGFTSGQLFTIDRVSPTVTGVSATTANGNYSVGVAVSVTVTFIETVMVTGMPQLTLETGSTDRTVNYASGSGSNTLTFTYTVLAWTAATDPHTDQTKLQYKYHDVYKLASFATDIWKAFDIIKSKYNIHSNEILMKHFVDTIFYCLKTYGSFGKKLYAPTVEEWTNSIIKIGYTMSQI
jgi:hypothetical protein